MAEESVRLNGWTRHGRTSAGCICGKKVRGVPKLRWRVPWPRRWRVLLRGRRINRPSASASFEEVNV